MIPKECKRLAEVDFPIAVVSRYSAREKAIRHGHPSTLHLWWARRPLAACRAMLMALLLPDPCDQNCEEEFKVRARRILPRIQGTPGSSDLELRDELLRFIGEFSSWGNSGNASYVEAARGLVKAAHGDEVPLVVDPFSGGGSIPLEALRVGCDAFASDLNPVAYEILKTVLEDIPRYGPSLADEVREVGTEVRTIVENELTDVYPIDPDQSYPLAYIWARTIVCDNCGAEIPLARGFWLSTKAKRKRALRYRILRPKGKTPEVVFEVFEPKSDAEVPKGTISRVKASCLCCSTVLAPERVRAQLSSQHGGANPTFDEFGSRIGGAVLLVVATLSGSQAGRQYRVAVPNDYKAVYIAKERLQALEDVALVPGMPLIPDEEIPRTELRRISLPIYGVERFRQMFTYRQLLTLVSLAKIIRVAGDRKVNEAVNRLLAFALDKTADLNNANTRWKPDAECPVNTLARHDIPMAWDFAEAAPLAEASGSFFSAFQRTADAIAPSYCQTSNTATTQLADACHHPLPDESASIWFTDPPYYDSVPYAHLSDFFLIWARRALTHGEKLPALSPKGEECVVDRPHSLIPGAKTAAQFENRIALAMKRGAQVIRADGAAAIVFAHKTTEGWESLLGGVIGGGWVITASWPIATEMKSRLNARDNASLSASVHLVARPRPEDASVGDWGDVLRELPNRVGNWIERLQAEGVRGADLVFACIGPAMEIYSRYRSVEDAEGRQIPLGGDPLASEAFKRGFLSYVWETVGRLALEEVLGTAEARARNGAAGALEEDSRLTALFLWTLQATDVKTANVAEEEEEEEVPDEEEETEKPSKKKIGYTLIYDVARRFAQPLGIHLEKWEGRIIETEKGVVRLLPVAERTPQLFGDADAAAISRRIEDDVKASRNYSFAFMQDAGAAPAIKPRGKGKKAPGSKVKAAEVAAPQQATTLDRVHAAMLLQSSGQTNGLRALLREEQQRGPDFVRLANALSALYPKDSDEKRLLDAMLLAVPRN
jgi:putative DNA methylase